MRIEGALPTFYNISQIAAQRVNPATAEQAGYAPGVVVEISDAYKNSIAGKPGETQEVAGVKGIEGCQTCKNRRYVDESSDSSVSYQTPAHISPEQSAGKVMAHEREHISNDKAKAEKSDRRVVSQTVSLSTSICPECGKPYVSGGRARTVTAGKNNDDTSAESAEPAENNTAET
ncbi:MAG: hypothetical protein LBU88_10355 [Treponema sp.]|jgi:hypothetical protein|nr:hypothetical protein [Treponema sp.]